MTKTQDRSFIRILRVHHQTDKVTVGEGLVRRLHTRKVWQVVDKLKKCGS